LGKEKLGNGEEIRRGGNGGRKGRRGRAIPTS